MPPEPIGHFLERVRRRRIAIDVFLALACGFATFAGVGALTSILVAVVTAVVAAGAVVGVRRRHWTTAAAARDIERVKTCRNLVITAEELGRHPERASAWVVERVAADAYREAKDVRVGQAIGAAKALLACGVALLIGIAAVVLSRHQSAAETVGELARSTVNTILGRTDGRITVAIRPPAYSKIAATRVVDPERLEVLEGSRLLFSGATGAALRFGDRTFGTLQAGVATEVVARESGYFAIDAPDAADGRRLIALSVRRDSAPAVKIEQPAKDLLFPTADRTIPLKITAADDLALASLELRYVTVSGAGESFAFKEGTLPLRLSRGSAREWRADADMALASLKLQPGESLVYRAVARDARPGDGGIGTSDTFFVEIAGPGQIALEGVEMPPQEERYALSQQMIVLKIERLRARQASMPRDALAEETALLAAEQRTVRANFVFLLGGHVEDEEVEAEQSHEIAEGRLQNTARRDINRAIGDMTRAEQGLVAADTSAALPPARAAVESLQRAFGRARYLLRTLPVRSRIDPSRRLTGALAGASTWPRRAGQAPERQGAAARQILADLYVLSNALTSGAAVEPQAVDQLAESALAVDPAAAVWQEVSREIATLRTAATRATNGKSVLDRVIPRVAAEAGKGLVPQTPLARPKSALQRAWEGGGR